MLTGKHGIGKSQILKQFFEERGQKVVILFLGQMSDPGDLIGLPHLMQTDEVRIGTADIKDLYAKDGRGTKPLLEVCQILHNAELKFVLFIQKNRVLLSARILTNTLP
jgi:MoxR-like ATPase